MNNARLQYDKDYNFWELLKHQASFFIIKKNMYAVNILESIKMFVSVNVNADKIFNGNLNV